MTISFYTSLTAFISILVLALSSVPKMKPLIPFAVALLSALLVVHLDLPDYELYRELFLYAPTIGEIHIDPRNLWGSEDYYGETLYALLNSGFRIFTEDFKVFRFFVVFATLYLKVYFFQRVSPIASLAVVSYFALLFYVDSFILRQSIASALVAIALMVLLKDRRIAFLLIVVSASFFHISALLAIPLIFLYKLKLNKFFAFSILGSMVLIGLIGLGGMILMYTDSLTGSFRGLTQLSAHSRSEQGEAIGLLRGSVLIYLAILGAYIYYNEKISAAFPNYQPFLIFGLYTVSFIILFNDFVIIAERGFRLFGFVFPVLLAAVAKISLTENVLLRTFLLIFILILVSLVAQISERAAWL